MTFHDMNFVSLSNSPLCFSSLKLTEASLKIEASHSKKKRKEGKSRPGVEEKKFRTCTRKKAPHRVFQGNGHLVLQSFTCI